MNHQGLVCSPTDGGGAQIAAWVLESCSGRSWDGLWEQAGKQEPSGSSEGPWLQDLSSTSSYCRNP